MAKTVSKQTVNGVDYDIMDKTAREAIETINGTMALKTDIFSVFNAAATSITSGADLDDYTTPGNYKIANAATASTISHFPFNVGGRILVFETTNDSVKVQIASLNREDSLHWRFFNNATWTDWYSPIVRNDLVEDAMLSFGDVSEASTGFDLDDFPTNTIVGYTAGQISSLVNFPEVIKSGGLIITINSKKNKPGTVQIVMPWTDNSVFAKRIYINGSFRAWVSNGEQDTTFTVGTGKDYDDLVDCLDYITSDDLRNTWSENNRVTILLDEGTFSMDKVATLYEQDSTRYKWGVYVPRYCTIRGKGKGKTVLTYNYTGDDDWARGHLSPLNMPYESALEGVSIIVKNARYCVHSDGDEPFNRAWALSNNKISVKNCYFEHQGFTGESPSYNVPAAWGQGFRDNVVREFISCDFVATRYPWFTHDTIGQKDPSSIIFEDCTFINLSNEGYGSGTYGGPTFITWGTNIINQVYFRNCYTNRFIRLRATTTYEENAKCDYFVSDDGTNMITEGRTNNAHLENNWINRNCEVGKATSSITGYKPVSIDTDGFVSAYSATAYKHGISLFSCGSGEPITVQCRGLIDLNDIGVSGFSAGTKVGWNGNAWVEDNNHPMLTVINSNIGELI